jgi:hypothetical protein
MKLRHRSRLPMFILASAVSFISGICAAVWLTEHTNPNAPIQSLAPNAANQSSAAYIERANPPKLLFLAPIPQPMGEAVPLGVVAHDLGDGGLAVVHGLANGTTLSIGNRLNDSDWWLSAIDLSATKIEPPANFVGAMDITVELRLPNTELVDRQTLHFAWQELVTVAETRVNNAETHAISDVDLGSPVISPSAPARRLSPEDVTARTK